MESLRPQEVNEFLVEFLYGHQEDGGDISCDAMFIMVTNYITKDPITLSYCLVQVVYSLQEVAVLRT